MGGEGWRWDEIVIVGFIGVEGGRNGWMGCFE